MNIVLINTEENRGGAAIACKRLLDSLNRMDGVKADLLVRTKKTDHPHVHAFAGKFPKNKLGKFYFLWERFVIFCNNRFSRKNLFAVSLANVGFDISTHPLVQQADIIHLHWINQGFLSLKSIQRLQALGKPIVWTMHDMWPVTGICHHARLCTSYTDKCGECFFLTHPRKNDVSFQTMRNKTKIWKDANIVFITCSDWLKSLARQSSLMQGNTVYTIPNPIDTVFFTPGLQVEARQQLPLPGDKKLLLFSAVNVSDPRKGIRHFSDALDILWQQHPELHDTLGIVLVGDTKKQEMPELYFPTISLGFVGSTDKMRTIYQAVDLYVTSSLEENLPNTIMEALSCGIPTVAYEIGGIPEMINHKQTGYLAKYKDTDDLAAGINDMLTSHMENRTALCRESALNRYNENLIAKRYLAIYKQQITNSSQL